MKIGDKAAANRISYEIVEKMGEGGQGSVWKAKRTDNGVLYAVKIINEKDPDKRRNKLNNIKRLIENSLDSSLKAPCDEHGVKFAFPIAQINDAATGETGYVMELASGKTLDSLWREGTLLHMGTRDKLEIAYKVAKAIDILHSHGYCYTDISWANFMWDKQNRRLYIIDCENAACSAHIDSGECHFLIGTGFFIAPEVAFGKAKVGFNSDLYALATMIFCLLTGNVLFSAYHGEAMYKARPMCQNMVEVAEYVREGDLDDDWQHFVFDPDDKRNGIDNLCVGSKNPVNIAFRKNLDEVIRIWNHTDAKLKALFYDAFRDPFDGAKRPMAYIWASNIKELIANGAKSIAAKPKEAHAPKAAANSPATANIASDEYPAFRPRHVDVGAVQDIYPAFNPIRPIGPDAGNAVLYPAFVPSKRDKTAYIKMPDGSIRPFDTDEYVLTGVPIGNNEAIGRFFVKGGDYGFVCDADKEIQILAADGSVKKRVKKGESVSIDSGDAISATGDISDAAILVF